MEKAIKKVTEGEGNAIYQNADRLNWKMQLPLKEQ